MRILLPLALIFLLAASACERVEGPGTTVLPPSPEVAGKFPGGQQPPQGAPPQPQPTTGPEQKAPEGKAPESPPTLSAKDLVLLDLEVTARNITAAKDSLSSQQVDQAKGKIEAALRSVSFLETSLPSSKVLELIERTLVQISQGDTKLAQVSAGEIVSTVPQVGGLSNAQEVAKLANDASASLSSGNLEAAKQGLATLASKIQAGDQEILIARLKDNLRGAQYAVYRDAIPVAKVELDEAANRLGQLRPLTEAAWSAPKG